MIAGWLSLPPFSSAVFNPVSLAFLLNLIFSTLLPSPSVLGFVLMRSFSFFINVILVIISTTFSLSCRKTVGLPKFSKRLVSWGSSLVEESLPFYLPHHPCPYPLHTFSVEFTHSVYSYLPPEERVAHQNNCLELFNFPFMFSFSINVLCALFSYSLVIHF